jgi:hypothetical protein
VQFEKGMERERERGGGGGIGNGSKNSPLASYYSNNPVFGEPSNIQLQ